MIHDYAVASRWRQILTIANLTPFRPGTGPPIAIA